MFYMQSSLHGNHDVNGWTEDDSVRTTFSDDVIIT